MDMNWLFWTSFLVCHAMEQTLRQLSHVWNWARQGGTTGVDGADGDGRRVWEGGR